MKGILITIAISLAIVIGLAGFLIVGNVNLSNTNQQLVFEKNQNSGLNSQLSKLQTDLNGAILTRDKATNDLSSVNNELTLTKTNLTSVNNELTSTKASLTSTQSQLTSTQNQLSTSQASLNNITSQLSLLQSKYPPKPFPDYTSLQNWVNTNMGLINTAAVNGKWEDVLAIQSKAFNDGYLVIGNYDFDTSMWVNACVGVGSIYSIGIGAKPGNILKMR